MARQIRETPILFGEDGKRFEEKMRNAKCTITPEQYAIMYSHYKSVLASLERGEIARKTRLAQKTGAIAK
ncbi:MAG: hypothetical protein IKN90_00640 [Treponema sp.]|jgi:hypothetical protein|nr:hypothetical protein [Treponema sp.]MBP5436713.1 hypothetical protein [Treponema sp.]MBP5576020.1 hypothetical protein [Treponema sp.]MBQ1593653.1 hypothetical protein [Treponema sp.]MBQ1726637.1 hypothetical protein [Treponema sp.]